MADRHPIADGAAGDLANGYRIAQGLTRSAGRTYYLASRLLPADARRAVYALYAYARSADDIVDRPGTPATQWSRLDSLEAGLAQALAGVDPTPAAGVDRAVGDVLLALADAVGRFRIPVETFAAFGRSMRMDLPGHPLFRNRYADLAELAEYTYGSAAVIGLQMLPILGADPVDEEIAAGAALLGDAFQLTNFLRDVGEDAARDRIYLPLDVLEAFGVDETMILDDAARGAARPATRRAIAHLIAVNRDQYRRTAPAIAALPARTRPAICAAARSYSAILTAIEEQDHDVFVQRAVVPVRRRAGHAIAAVGGLTGF